MGPRRKPYSLLEEYRTSMEIFIETLTGAMYSVQVSPFEKVLAVKQKIQKMEGLPIQQQHLIYQQQELDDDRCLREYGIHDRAVLKLVLAMRGGPINTRRIPMEEPGLREVAEYMEANKDDLMEKLPDNRNVTFLVFHDGDQFNFFRVVDRGDGTLTPLSETMSCASVYNGEADEDEDEQTLETTSMERLEENAKTKEKLKQLRLQMENMNISRKTITQMPGPEIASTSGGLSATLATGPISHSMPRLLSSKSNATQVSSRPGSKARMKQIASSTLNPQITQGSAIQNLSAHLPSQLQNAVPTARLQSLNRTPLLPPVGQAGILRVASAGSTKSNAGVPVSPSTVPPAARLSALREDTPRATTATQTDIDFTSPEPGSRVPSSRGSELRSPVVAPGQQASDDKEAIKPPKSPRKSRGSVGDEELWNLPPAPSAAAAGGVAGPVPVSQPRAAGWGRPPTSKRSSKGSRMAARELTLESLSRDEARAMSGLLRQASLERLGSSKLASFVRSGSRAQMTFPAPDVPDSPTDLPRMSSRLRRAGSSRKGGRSSPVTSPRVRLPPVKAKRKKFKRCFTCNKKTGLATSYQCRCGNNFCATHRYAEAHACSFDYKTEGRKLLQQANPVVSAPKLPKI